MDTSARTVISATHKPGLIFNGHEYILYLSSGDYVVTNPHYTSQSDPTTPPLNYLASRTFTEVGVPEGSWQILSQNENDITATYKAVALGNSAYAYAIYQTKVQTGDTQQLLTLGFVGSDGKSFTKIVAGADQPGYPDPDTFLSQPVFQLNTHDDTFSLTWDYKYIAGDPTFFPLTSPTLEKQHTDTYDDQGHLISQQSVELSGFTRTQYVNASGKVTSDYDLNADGSTTYATFNPVTGDLLRAYTRFSDGGFETVDDNVLGKPYASQNAIYDKNGKLLSMERIYGGGLEAFYQVNNADGSGTVDNWDTIGRETTSIDFAADGSRDVTRRTYEGIEATPSAVEVDHFGSDNKIATSDVTAADGSHSQTAFVSNVTLTSHAGVSDTFRSSSAASDTFAFQLAFGQDLVTNFHAVAGPGSAHDILQLDTAVVPDYQHLQSMLSQTSAGTLITIDPTDTILLKGVRTPSLTASDFTFIHNQAVG